MHDSLFPNFYSTPSIVSYYLLRYLPFLLLRNQNQVFSAPGRLFTSIDKSFSSSVENLHDFKELIPEFYYSAEFLVNTKELEAEGDETLEDVEVPLWCRDPTHFVQIMREALESDCVSKYLHNWIDLTFGVRQRDWEYQDTCYGVDWENLTELKQEAYQVLVREFGQAPLQLFSTPHLKRVFSLSTEPLSFELVLKCDSEVLKEYLETLQNKHQELLERIEKHYSEQSEKSEKLHIRKMQEIQTKINQKRDQKNRITHEFAMMQNRREQQYESILNEIKLKGEFRKSLEGSLRKKPSHHSNKSTKIDLPSLNY